MKAAVAESKRYGTGRGQSRTLDTGTPGAGAGTADTDETVPSGKFS